jgi:tetratricopeptide (TPR) repeat protein/transcriptional regulator with XRE-family HTH domain
MTLEELADKSGVSVRAISDFERGRTRRPYPRTVRLLAAALELPWPDHDEQIAPARPDHHSDASRPTTAALTLPAQLPKRLRNFSGRAAELALLAEWLDEGGGSAEVIVAISGTAGVGKTALAVEWAHRVADRFPDGQLYIDLAGFGPVDTPVTPVQAIRRFLDGLSVTPAQVPAEPSAQAALYRRLLAGRRLLVVLDNARDAVQVRPLLSGSPGCLVLVTSRNELTGLAAADDAHLLALDVMTDQDARDLLGRRLGLGRVTREDAVATTELIGLCARLPLALSIAAARAAVRPSPGIAAVAATLRDSGTRLDGLATGDAATDVRTVFSWSCDQLSAPAARMFFLLALHPGPDATTEAAASLTGSTAGSARRALAELRNAHLLTEHAPGRFTCHDLLRAYAAEQALDSYSEADRGAALHRLLDHYLHTAYSAWLLVNANANFFALDPPQPHVQPERIDDHEQALTWLTTERQVLVGAVRLAAAEGFSTHAWQLPRTVAMFFSWHGYWHELATTEQHALAALGQTGDLASQVPPHRLLALARRRLGDIAGANAHLHEALQVARELGSNVLQARVHTDLADAFEDEGRSEIAIGHAEQALALYRAAGDPAGERAALNNLGWCHARRGSYHDALEICGQALAMAAGPDSERTRAATLHSIGYAHHQLGQQAQAIACFQEAIRVGGQLGDQHHRATFLIHLGDAHQAAGDDGAARAAWRQALQVLDDLNDPAADQVRARLGHRPRREFDDGQAAKSSTADDRSSPLSGR